MKFLAQGQAVPEWLCKAGYLEVSRAARHRLSPARPEPVSVHLLVQSQPGWAEAAPQHALAAARALLQQQLELHRGEQGGQVALQQARRQP